MKITSLFQSIFVLSFLLFSNPIFSQNEFITTWLTTVDNESITIPTIGGGYNYSVDWGDGQTSNNQTGNASHTYSSAGVHQISITGDF
ncbi:MAG: PKD domain-containing protein, partial [Bacteroidota bacterium]